MAQVLKSNMDHLSQHLKPIRKEGYKHKKNNSTSHVIQSNEKRYHLDELVDVAVHNLMRRDAWKNLEVLSSDIIMGPRQGLTSIFPDTRCLRTHLLFAFCSCLLHFWMRSNLFQWGSGRGSLCGFRDGGGWSNRSPLLDNLHHFLPQARKRLILLGIQLLIEFGHHLNITKNNKSY